MSEPATHNLIDFALFDGVKDRHPKQKVLPWAKFAEQLTQHTERTEKDGPLFSPTLYRRRAARGLEGVQTLSCLVLDLDAGVPLDTFTATWEPYEYVAYSTFSHSAEKPKFRAVFPLTQAVAADEWPRVYRNLVASLGLGFPDPSCKDASRIYYLPSCAREAPRFALQHPGAWLDPAAFADVSPETAEPAPTSVAPRTSASATFSGGRVEATELLTRALDRCDGDGRNNAGLWLACQLRDNRFSREEAEAVLTEYQGRVPDTGSPYTLDEALHSLDQAFQSAPREAWEQARHFFLGGAAQPEADDLDRALEVAKAAVAALAADPGAIYTPDALQALGALRRWLPVEWARLSAEIKKRQANLKELTQQLERRQAKEEQETGPRPRRAGDMLDECPVPSLIIPAPYILKPHATGRIVDTDLGSGIRDIAFAPILITGRARDTDSGEESLRLTWRRNGRWQSRIVNRGHALASRELAKLATYGFPYHEEHGKLIASYITCVEAANSHELPEARVTSHLGWQGPSDDSPFLCGAALILPDGELDTAAHLDAASPESWSTNGIMFHGLGDGEAQIIQSFAARGTWEGWLAAVRPAMAHHRAAVAFYAAFCPPLLEIFNVPNFILDLGGPTSTGKTTTLRLVASVWFNPDDRTPTSGIYSWDVTRVFVERLVHTLSGFPLILDDTKRIKNDRLAAEIIYLATNGRGRGRGALQGVAHTTSGRTVLFSTGEQPVTSFTQDGGTRTRTLSVRGLPFSTHSPEGGALAKQISRQICEHYGHAGPRFMQWVMTQKADWPEWRRQYETWVDYYSSQPPTPEAGRLAQYAALVSIAGKLAHAALALPWEYANPMLEIWRELADAGTDAAGHQRALETVLAWAYSHERSFYGRTKQDIFGREDGGPHEVSGRWDSGEDWEFLAFFRTVLDRILADHGYQAEGILTGWREKGWLDCADGGFTKRTRCGGGNAPHMVKIRRAAIEAIEGGKGSQNAA